MRDPDRFTRWGMPELGTNYGEATADPFWDAIHLMAPGERERTLCGHTLDEVATVCSMDSGYKPGEGGGCWTCLSESNHWADRERTTS